MPDELWELFQWVVPSALSWQTVHRRFAEWSAARVRAKLHWVLLDELGAAGELDWSWCAIDSVSVRSSKGGLAGPKRVDCGKLGSEVHVLTDRAGLPIFVGVSAANTHDMLGRHR